MSSMDLFDDDPAGDAAPTLAAVAAPDASTDPVNFFPDVFAFVDDLLVHVYARRHNLSQDFKWCPWWSRHPEAVSRLEALWKAFEALRQDPGTGGSNWWNHHADPTMHALTAANGTFKECSDSQHVAPPVLASISPRRS